MHQLDLIDETYIVGEPERLRDLVCDEHRWRRWFPDLELTCFEDRGERGKRWTVAGALVGTAEVWLERSGEGTIVHVFVQADPVRQVRCPRRLGRRMHRRYAVPLKREITAVKDDVERGRNAGEPPTPPPRSSDRSRRGSLAHDPPANRHRTRGATDEETSDGRPDDQ